MSTGKIMAKPGKIGAKTGVFGHYPYLFAGLSDKLRVETGLRFGAFQNMLI
jgi:hypothetical protein